MSSLIDVIVPVYNTPQKDLDKLLNSILHQTFTAWRLCMIDDGSNEDTARYLDDLANKDSRIEVYHYKNGGPPVARNRGLSLIEAPYFMLVDSDDILLSDFLEHSYQECIENDLDMIIGSIECIDESEKHLKYCRPSFNNTNDQETKIYKGEEIISLIDYAVATSSNTDNLELNNTLLARLYPKLIKTSIFKQHNIHFEENMFNHDDNIFSFDCMLRFNMIGVTEHIYYYYIEHSYSIVHRKASRKIFNEELEYIKALEARKYLLATKRCEAALANRYLILSVSALTVAALCKELRVAQAYDEIDQLISLEDLPKRLLKNRYSMSKLNSIVYQILKIKNKAIRKMAIVGLFFIYKKIRG